MTFSNKTITATSKPELSYRAGDQQFIQRAEFHFGSLNTSSTAEIEIEFTAVLVPSANQGKGSFNLKQSPLKDHKTSIKGSPLKFGLKAN